MQLLQNAKLGKEYIIHKVLIEHDELLSTRLMHLGFIEKSPLIVINKTPLTSDALLVQIKGTQIALTKQESELILISNSETTV